MLYEAPKKAREKQIRQSRKERKEETARVRSRQRQKEDLLAASSTADRERPSLLTLFYSVFGLDGLSAVGRAEHRV